MPGASLCLARAHWPGRPAELGSQRVTGERLSRAGRLDEIGRARGPTTVFCVRLFVRRAVVRPPWGPARRRLRESRAPGAPGAPGGEGQQDRAAGSISGPTRSRGALAVRMRVRQACGARRLRFELSAVS